VSMTGAGGTAAGAEAFRWRVMTSRHAAASNITITERGLGFLLRCLGLTRSLYEFIACFFG